MGKVTDATYARAQRGSPILISLSIVELIVHFPRWSWGCLQWDLYLPDFQYPLWLLHRQSSVWDELVPLGRAPCGMSSVWDELSVGCARASGEAVALGFQAHDGDSSRFSLWSES